MVICDSNRPEKASLIKVRYIVIVLATLCPTVCYISRQNLSMAMVALIVDSSESKFTAPTTTVTTTTLNNNNTTNQTDHRQVNNNHHEEDDACPIPIQIGEDGKTKVQMRIKTYGPKYDWSPSNISLIFEAFFITYVICQIPAARFSEIVGADYILLTATIGSSLLSAIIPLAASIHPWLFALIRALMGICQSALYPACYVLYTHWLPPNERSQAFPMLMVGAFIGSIITSTATGYLSEHKSYGWEYSFYLASVICLLWAIMWLLFGAGKPRQHGFISLEEIEYIESRMEIKRLTPTTITSKGDKGDVGIVKKSPSWRKLLTSQHVLAMSVAFFASNWSFTTTLLLLPRYLNDILHVPPLRNGLINSIIYILYCLGAPIVGFVSTIMVETRLFGWTSLTIRKLFTSVALFGQMICFVLIIMIGCDTTLVLATLYIQVLLYSLVNGGEVQVPSELSIDFAGTIFAIGNCIGSSTGFIIPRIQSLLVPNTHIRSDWESFFYLAALISLIGGLVFLFFGKNDLQNFAADDDDSEETQHIDVYRNSISNEFGSTTNQQQHPPHLNQNLTTHYQSQPPRTKYHYRKNADDDDVDCLPQRKEKQLSI